MDLRVRPGPGVARGLTVPGTDLLERFSRSSGPGGQGVNTADSRVELRFDVAGSPLLSDVQRERALRVLAGRLTGGWLVVTASAHRNQRANRVAARERMADLLGDALAPPGPARRPTKPTRGSQLRRLDAKRRRSRTKAGRSRPEPD